MSDLYALAEVWTNYEILILGYATLKSCNNSETEQVFCRWFPLLLYYRWYFIIKDSTMVPELVFKNESSLKQITTKI
jgi:hypothetical protein